MNVVLVKRIIVVVAFALLSLSIFFSELMYNLSYEVISIDKDSAAFTPSPLFQAAALFLLAIYLFFNLINKKAFGNISTSWLGMAFLVAVFFTMMSPTDFIFSASINVVAIRYLFFSLIGSLITINLMEEYSKEESI